MKDRRQHLVYAALAAHLEAGHGEAVAIRSQRRVLRYAELAAAVADGAGRIGELAREGGRVVIAARDQLDAGIAFLATLAAGRVPLIVDPTAVEAVAGLVARYAAAAAIVEARIGERLSVPWIDAAESGTWGDGSAALVLAAVAPSDAAFWTFTSGTTGDPRAVVHAHRGPLAAHRAFAEGVIGLEAGDRTIATGGLPFVYVLGNSFLFPLFAGASTILPGELLLPTVLSELARHEATVLVSGPWSLAAIARSAKHEGWIKSLRRLRRVLSAGEALPAKVFAAWVERFGVPPLDNLGCTEMFNSFVANAPGDAMAGALGRVVDGFRVRIGGQAPRPGLQGGLEIAGESRAIAVGGGEGGSEPQPTRGEWCETGDVVRIDADLRFHFLGRSDDRLKIHGRFVHPLEIERQILEVDAVADCLVTTESDPSGVAVLVALIVPVDPGDAEDCRARVSRHARRWLAAHEVPSELRVVESLPRSARGKLLRPRVA